MNPADYLFERVKTTNQGSQAKSKCSSFRDLLEDILDGEKPQDNERVSDISGPPPKLPRLVSQPIKVIPRMQVTPKAESKNKLIPYFGEDILDYDPFAKHMERISTVSTLKDINSQQLVKFSKVRISCNYKTKFGEDLWLVGSCAMLG